MKNTAYMGIENACNNSDLNNKDVKHGWIKSDKASLFFTNPEYEALQFDPDSIDWKYILKPLEIEPVKTENKAHFSGLFDRLVYSDTHIAMNPNPDGFSLYGGEWNEEILNNRLVEIIEHVKENINSETLIVDDLGDLADGYDGQTVRKGHDLPQNMDNQKAFDVALHFKFNMYRELKKLYKVLIFNNICRSNHSSSFDYIINSAFKNMVELIDNETVITNHRKFINHYEIGDNVFIITHGKDDVNLKTGFKPKLDKSNQEKIDDYIDENYLYSRDKQIEFSKGDSHQMLFDWSSSDRFNYFNYPALSPSSSWVQTNFKKGKSGVVLFNYYKSNQSNIFPLWFKWE
jgi:hypothetical protein